VWYTRQVLLYRAVRALLRAALNVFFREIHLVGSEHVPPEGAGPVVFVGNHPNSLIDPALVVSTSGRIVHFAAKDKLFAPPMSFLLGALGAVPIARAMDHGDKGKRDNSGALAALSQVLVEGRAMGIFPEGLSHDKAHLQRMRSGAARIALQTAAEHPHCAPLLVPVGLTYMHRKSFRSQVLVQFGSPIPVGPEWIERWQADQRDAARALTATLEVALRSLTVNAPDWDTLRMLDGVRRLYQPERIAMADRVELARRFSEAYGSIAQEPRVAAFVQRMEAYLDELDDLDIDDRDLVRGVQPGRALGNIVRLLLWVPLALPGLPVHAPIYLAIDWAGRHFSPRKDVIGTSRVVMGMVTVLALYIALPLVAAWFGGLAVGIGVAAALPLSGLALLKVLERSTSLARLWTSAVAGFTLGERARALRARRDAMEAEVVELVDAYMPEDMVPLFPRGDSSPTR
jgi:glycerol-3-phosphate O-acyltransferase / dihydroxyacetone phosphate acyltransferase